MLRCRRGDPLHLEASRPQRSTDRGSVPLVEFHLTGLVQRGEAPPWHARGPRPGSRRLAPPRRPPSGCARCPLHPAQVRESHRAARWSASSRSGHARRSSVLHACDSCGRTGRHVRGMPRASRTTVRSTWSGRRRFHQHRSPRGATYRAHPLHPHRGGAHPTPCERECLARDSVRSRVTRGRRVACRRVWAATIPVPAAGRPWPAPRCAP